MIVRPVRIAMVVSCYFPIITESTLRLMLVAQQLQDAGIAVDVITKHWFRRWPKKVRTGEATIYRVDAPSRLGLHGSGFARQARQRILDNQAYYAAVLLDRFDDTAEHFARFRPKNCGQLLLRLAESDIAADYAPREKIQAIVEKAGKNAGRWDQVLVPDRSTWDLLDEEPALQKYRLSGHLQRVFDLEPTKPKDSFVSRSIGDRRVARQVLGETCQELMATPMDRIVVVFCDFEFDRESLKLLEAIGPLTENRSRLRLWFAGMSACAQDMMNLVEQRNWKYSVSFVGTFSDVGSLLQVADMIVIPGQRQGGTCIQGICIRQKIPFLSLSPEDGISVQSDPRSPVFPSSLAALKVSLRKWYDDSECAQHDLLQVHNKWIARNEWRSEKENRPLSLASEVANRVLQRARVADA
jgi:hypothetical protein